MHTVNFIKLSPFTMSKTGCSGILEIKALLAFKTSLKRQIIYVTQWRFICVATTLKAQDIPELSLRKLPYPSYVNDIIGFFFQFIFPLLFLIAFLYNCINIVKYISIEKEFQLKESMKIMGLPS